MKPEYRATLERTKRNEDQSSGGELLTSFFGKIRMALFVMVWPGALVLLVVGITSDLAGLTHMIRDDWGIPIRFQTLGLIGLIFLGSYFPVLISTRET